MRKKDHVTSSLNFRLINLMVLFALVIIASFTAIQVYNQLQNATDQNLYRSKLSSVIIHQNLQLTLDQAINEGKSKKELIQNFQQAINKLTESEASSEIYIADRSGKIIAEASSAGQAPPPLSLLDFERIQNIFDLDAIDSWSYPFINQGARTVETLILLTADRQVAYVLKTAYDLGNLKEALKAVYVPVIITAVLIIFLSITHTLALSRKIVKPILTLNEASKKVAAGDLKLQVRIRTNDEIEELSLTFNDMTQELSRMKDIAENANPLTKLPGNYLIREEIEKRIQSKKTFVVVHLDLDNFKVFNDTYGIGAGDIAIKMTAELLKVAVEKYGGADDFLGHEGGDDFVLLSTVKTVKPISEHFILEFDKKSKELYSKEDRAKGYVMGKERRAEGMGGEDKGEKLAKFPLMSISLSALSDEEKPFDSYGEITNRISSVKNKSKRQKGSSFVLDQN